MMVKLKLNPKAVKKFEKEQRTKELQKVLKAREKNKKRREAAEEARLAANATKKDALERRRRARIERDRQRAKERKAATEPSPKGGLKSSEFENVPLFPPLAAVPVPPTARPKPAPPSAHFRERMERALSTAFLPSPESLLKDITTKGKGGQGKKKGKAAASESVCPRRSTYMAPSLRDIYNPSRTGTGGGVRLKPGEKVIRSLERIEQLLWDLNADKNTLYKAASSILVTAAYDSQERDELFRGKTRFLLWRDEDDAKEDIYVDYREVYRLLGRVRSVVRRAHAWVQWLHQCDDTKRIEDILGKEWKSNFVNRDDELTSFLREFRRHRLASMPTRLATMKKTTTGTTAVTSRPNASRNASRVYTQQPKAATSASSNATNVSDLVNKLTGASAAGARDPAIRRYQSKLKRDLEKEDKYLTDLKRFFAKTVDGRAPLMTTTMVATDKKRTSQARKRLPYLMKHAPEFFRALRGTVYLSAYGKTVIKAVRRAVLPDGSPYIKRLFDPLFDTKAEVRKRERQATKANPVDQDSLLRRLADANRNTAAKGRLRKAWSNGTDLDDKYAVLHAPIVQLRARGTGDDPDRAARSGELIGARGANAYEARAGRPVRMTIGDRGRRNSPPVESLMRSSPLRDVVAILEAVLRSKGHTLSNDELPSRAHHAPERSVRQRAQIRYHGLMQRAYGPQKHAPTPRSLQRLQDDYELIKAAAVALCNCRLPIKRPTLTYAHPFQKLLRLQKEEYIRRLRNEMNKPDLALKFDYEWIGNRKFTLLRKGTKSCRAPWKCMQLILDSIGLNSSELERMRKDDQDVDDTLKQLEAL